MMEEVLQIMTLLLLRWNMTGFFLLMPCSLYDLRLVLCEENFLLLVVCLQNREEEEEEEVTVGI